MRFVSCIASVIWVLGAGAAWCQELAAGRSQIPPAAKPAQPTTVAAETRGDVFMARKMYREGIEAYKEVQPQTAVTLNKIGIGYHHMLDLNSAKSYYEKAIKLKKDYSEAINNLGTVYYAKKNYRKSISYYKKALVYAPNSASIHSNLGTALFARKDYPKAAEEYELALRLDPEVFEHRSTQGVLLQERSVEERAKFHYYLAKTYAKAGQTDRALLYIRRALEEGFKDKAKFLEEPEFADLRKNPDFELLMKMEPRVL